MGFAGLAYRLGASMTLALGLPLALGQVVDVRANDEQDMLRVFGTSSSSATTCPNHSNTW